MGQIDFGCFIIIYYKDVCKRNYKYTTAKKGLSYKLTFHLSTFRQVPQLKYRPHHRDHMVVVNPTTCEIIAYHHQCCEFEPRSWQGVVNTTLCDKVYQLLTTGQWFSPGTLVSSNNKTDRHDITEILLKVALNTINNKPTIYQ